MADNSRTITSVLGLQNGKEIDAMKYNGAKESRDHIETKNMIGEFLELNEKV